MDNNQEDENSVEFLSSYTIATLGIKYDKWKKMMTINGFKFIVFDWLNNKNRKVLIFILASNGQLIPTLLFDKSKVDENNKSVYFIKKELVTITLENFHHQVIMGDISNSSTINFFTILFDEILCPLLRNSLNQKLLPGILQEDIETETTEISNALAEIKQKFTQKTTLLVTVREDKILDIADKLEKGETSLCDQNSRNKIEGMVIKWVTQVHTLLQENTEEIDNHLPSDEISFWNLRKYNLENIYQQLCSPHIKSVVKILECIHSSSIQPFKSTLKNLIMALYEAKDISLWLNPIQQQISTFEEVNFINSKIIVKSLVHVIYIICSNSRYYCNKMRIITLLKAFCNLFIQKATKDLNLENFMLIKLDDTFLQIEKSIEIFDYFKQEINAYKKKILLQITTNTTANTHQIMPINEWSFSNEQIYEKLDSFIAQLKDLKEMFAMAISFQNLDKVEIAGNKGKFLTNQIRQFQKEFQELFRKWTSTIVLNLFDSNSMIQEYRDFKLKRMEFLNQFKIIEEKVGTILSRAFDNCTNVEHMIKLAQMSKEFLQRSSVHHYIKDIQLKAFELYKEDISQVKELLNTIEKKYNEQGIQAIPIDNNFPLIAGSIMYLFKIRGRITQLTDMCLLDNGVQIIGNNHVDIISSDRNSLLQIIESIQNKIIMQWDTENIYKLAKISFNSHCISRNSRTNMICVNTPEGVEYILKEVKYLHLMKVSSIYDEFLKINNLSNDFYMKKSLLLQFEDYYNEIRSEFSPLVIHLVRKELLDIDEKINEVSETLTWKSKDIELIKTVYLATKDLNLRLHDAQNNLNKLLQDLHKWSKKSLFKVYLSKKGLLNTKHRQRVFVDYLLKHQEAQSIINSFLLKNFRLFFNYKENNIASHNFINHGNHISLEKFLSMYPKDQTQLYDFYRKYVYKLIANEILFSIKIRLQGKVIRKIKIL